MTTGTACTSRNGNQSENYANDGINRLAICQHYTTEIDGGHLGSVSSGKIRVAKAYWVLMAQIAGWQPYGGRHANADAHANTDTHADTHTHGNAYTDRRPADSHPDPDAHADRRPADGHLDPDAHADRRPADLDAYQHPISDHAAHG